MVWNGSEQAGTRLMRWPVDLAGRRHRRLARIALSLTALGVLTLLLGACSQLKAASTTAQALAHAGYAQPGVNVNTNVTGGQSSQTVVRVRYASRAHDDAALGAEQDRAAQIVWEHAPVRLSEVLVVAVTHQVGVPGLGGVQTSRERAYSREELTNRYGPRPAGLDNPSARGIPTAAEPARPGSTAGPRIGTTVPLMTWCAIQGVCDARCGVPGAGLEAAMTASSPGCRGGRGAGCQWCRHPG